MKRFSSSDHQLQFDLTIMLIEFIDFTLIMRLYFMRLTMSVLCLVSFTSQKMLFLLVHYSILDYQVNGEFQIYPSLECNQH